MKHNTTEVTSALLREHYFHTLHPSGLEIYVFPKRLTATVASFAVRYGSLDNRFSTDGVQPPKQIPQGVAHFLEHKLFENEDGSDACETLAALGADANAYTTYDRTAYLFSCTEGCLPAMEELLRFVMHPHFSEGSVAREVGIITEEIGESEDSPWDQAYRELLCSLYHKHPVREPICGSARSIRRITPALLYECHRAFYRPENMILTVCGEVDNEAILEVVDRVLQAPADLPAPVRATEKEPNTVARAHFERLMPVAKPIFCIGMKDNDLPADPEARLRHDLCMNLLCEILFSQSNEFYGELFEAGIISPGFSYGYFCGEDYGYWCISGESDTPKVVHERLLALLADVKQKGVDPEAFERCKRILYADELRAYDSTDEISMRLLAFAVDGCAMFSCPEVIQSIKKEELDALAATKLLPELLAAVTVKSPDETGCK